MTIDPAPNAVTVAPGFPFRLAVFGLVTFVLYQFLYGLLQGERGEEVSGENGPVEILQVVLAVTAAIAIFAAARRASVGRAAMTLSACVVGYAAARESDAWLEALLFDDAYKYLVGVPLVVIAAVTVYRHRRGFVRESWWLMHQPAAVIYILAGIYLGGVCQIFDRPGMWLGIETLPEATAAKLTVEEFSELFAYLLFAFSGIETYLLSGTPAIKMSSQLDATEESVTLPHV